MEHTKARTVRRRREDWLRRSGLSLVLPPRMRARSLIVRTAPVMLAVLVELVAVALTGRVDAGLQGRDIDALKLTDGLVTTAFIAFILTISAPLLGLLLAWLMLRIPRPVRVIVALTVLLATLVIPAAIGVKGFRVPLWVSAVAASVVLLLGYLGFGSMLGWLARRGIATVANVGPMVTRAMPVLVMATMFFFFNAEIWQVANNVSIRRALLIGVGLLALAVIIVVVAMRDEVNRLRRELDEANDERSAGILAATPFEAASTAAAPPLRYAERVNLVLVPVIAQLVQVALFAAIITVFFYCFGLLAVADETAKQWIGKPAEQFGGILAGVPGSWSLLKVSLVLGAFCGLSFAASSASDTAHRATFVRPILADLEQALAARDAYVTSYRSRASTDERDPAQTPAESGELDPDRQPE